MKVIRKNKPYMYCADQALVLEATYNESGDIVRDTEDNPVMHVVLRNNTNAIRNWVGGSPADGGHYVYGKADLSENDRRLIHSVGYGPTVYKQNQILERIFIECTMIIDLTHDHHFEYAEEMKKIFRDLKAKGNVFTILMNYAGGKMGGKRFPVYFYGKTNPLHEYETAARIREYIAKLDLKKQFEREKKLIGDDERFPITPRVKIVADIPGMPGVAWADQGWMNELGLKPGFKLSGVAKATVLPIPFHFNFGPYDLIIQECENKLDLPADLFAANAGWSPSLDAECRNSANLTTITKAGKTVEGRYPNLGIDVLATLNYLPKIDVSKINQVLAWDWTEELKEKFLMYRDNTTGELLLNDLGKKIFDTKNPKDMNDVEVKLTIHDMLMSEVRRMCRLAVAGVFGTAAPLSMCPLEAKAGVKPMILIGYSGGIICKGDAVVYEDVMYIEDSVWLSMGRDFDGDLAFMFSFNQFNADRNTSLDINMVNDEATLRKLYTLPVKTKDEPDSRDEFDVLFEVKQAGGLTGQVYNIGKIFLECCRILGMDKKTVSLLEIRTMAKLEHVIAGFKGKLLMDKPLKVEDLAREFHVEGITADMEKLATNWFYSIRRRGGWVNVSKTERITAFEMMARLAKQANPNSRIFSERVCALFKNINFNAMPVLKS